MSTGRASSKGLQARPEAPEGHLQAGCNYFQPCQRREAAAIQSRPCAFGELDEPPRMPHRSRLASRLSNQKRHSRARIDPHRLPRRPLLAVMVNAWHGDGHFAGLSEHWESSAKPRCDGHFSSANGLRGSFANFPAFTRSATTPASFAQTADAAASPFCL